MRSPDHKCAGKCAHAGAFESESEFKLAYAYAYAYTGATYADEPVRNAENVTA